MRVFVEPETDRILWLHLLVLLVVIRASAVAASGVYASFGQLVAEGGTMRMAGVPSDDHVALAQRCNLRRRETPARQRGLSVLPGSARRAAYRRGGPTQTWRGSRLSDA